MKNLLFIGLVVMGFATSCVKGDKKNTKYLIEVSGTNIETVDYITRDHGPVSAPMVGQSAFSIEWKGYKSNDITVSVSSDGPATIKIYEKGKVVVEKSGVNYVDAHYEN